MKIADLAKEIAETRQQATESLDDVPLTVRPGREAARNAAARKLRTLEAEFRQVVADNAGYIVVNGEAYLTEQFADVAEDEGNAIIIDANELPTDLAYALWYSMPTRTLNANHITLFNTALSNIMAELGAMATVPLNIGPLVAAGKVYDNVNGLTDDIKAIIRKSVGVELEVPYLRYRAANEALSAGYTQNFVPMVVLGANGDDELVKGLSKPNEAVVVEVREGDVEAQVKQAFKKLKEQFKNKRK